MIIDPAQAPESGRNGVRTVHLSVAGGVRQFGAYVETLDPGAWSSERHWHTSEDEFVLVLDGVVTLRDNDGLQDLHPGDAICWPHGVPNAHHLTNRGTGPCRFLIVGTRILGDVCHYPDSGNRLVNADTTWQVLDRDGTVLRGGALPDELLGLPPAWGKVRASGEYPAVIRAGDAATDFGTPDQVARLGAFEGHLLSDAGGLTQFGAFVEVLMPGSRSSDRHWHEAEDEFLFVLDGHPTVVEDDGLHDLGPGDAAAWPAGVPNAHHVANLSEAPCRHVVVGTRLPSDRVHYAEVDRLYTRLDGVATRTRRDGSPLDR